MRRRVNIEKRGKEWTVFLRSGRVVYASTNYAKSIGVVEYLESRVAEQAAETRRIQLALREARQ